MSASKNKLKQSDVKKVENAIDKITTILNEKGEYAYFIVDDDDVKLASKGNVKDETKDNFLKKINGKKRYVNKNVYEMRISINKQYIKETSKFVAGPLSLKIKQYIINKKFKLEHHAEHIDGAVWYTNDDIINHGFHFGKLKEIINAIHRDNLDILNIAGVRAVDILND